MKTKFGTVKISSDGYYQIKSKKEGNFGKKLHRLIFEDFYQIKLPKHIIIHHDDGDKLNNEIWNLIPMTIGEHNVIPHKGKIPHNLGKSHSMEVKYKQSNWQNTTGYFRVSKCKCDLCKQGFIYLYTCRQGGKRIRIKSVDINKLKEKVLNRGLLWKKLTVECES